MRAKYVGNKADRIIMTVKNGEASASIPRGTPVILELSTTASNTDDGLLVILPSTAGSAHSFAFRYGVLADTMAYGEMGESILFGMSSYALVTRMTRAASSDSWTSSASIASGVALAIDTVNNAFLIGASSAGSLQAAAANAILVDSIASSAASATATSDTRTAIVTNARAFVRML